MSQDQEYHERRAAAELRRAAEVAVPEAVRAHQLLAKLHRERAEAGGTKNLAVVLDR